MYDAIIIGAGVTGCAIARELSRYQLNILVLEKEEDVCCGTSKANSAIIHAGHAKPGSLKARFNVRGNELMDQLSADLDFPFTRNGSLVLCFEESQIPELEELADRGRKNGVPGLSIVTGEAIKSLEPALSDDVKAVLVCPTGGIVCPFLMTIALAENAAVNGVSFRFDTTVKALSRNASDGLWNVLTAAGDTFEARCIINAAGVYADELHNQVSARKLSITPRRGEYQLLDKNFPTVDPADPYSFTDQEAEIMERLSKAFMGCEKLQRHMKFLLAKGSLYKVYNNNLLYHGCVPLNEDGTLKSVEIYGKKYRGRALYDALDNYVRKGFVAVDRAEREKGRDLMWYIWLSENSPLFGKDKMATFERYFLAEKETHKEVKNPYYRFLENEEVIDRILREFGLEPEGAHIINGHVPVKTKDGESPIKCGGKLLVIDGGFSRAYQEETGIAGYTLIYNSYGLILAAHKPFESTESAIENESDIHSESTMVKWVAKRKRVGDTDAGRELREKIRDLEGLLEAYYSGAIAEKFTG